MHAGRHVAEIGNLAVERPHTTSIGFGRVTLVAEELGVDARAPLNRFPAGGLFRWLSDVGNVGRNRSVARPPSLNASKLAARASIPGLPCRWLARTAGIPLPARWA